MPKLKRTQMYLPDETLRTLKKKSKEEKTTVSDLVRNAVSEFLGKDRKKNWSDDPLWKMVGSTSSKEKDLSVNHDEYLYGKGK